MYALRVPFMKKKSSSLLEAKEKLELEGERGVGHDHLLAVDESQLQQRLVQVGPRLGLQPRRESHVERDALAADRRLLELRLGPHGQGVQHVLERRFGVHLERPSLVSADGAVGLALVLKGVSVDAVVPGIHHVVAVLAHAQAGRGVGGNLESLVAACRGDDGIRRSDGGNDILDRALGESVGDPRDVELIGAGESLLVEPANVLRIVLVQLGERLLLVPGDHVRPFDAMLRLPWDRSDGAERNGGSRCVHVQLALYTGCHPGDNNPGLALEALSTAVYKGLHGVGTAVRVLLRQTNKLGIYPSTGLDAVQPADDELELHVEVVVKVLDAAVVRGDADAVDALLDETGGDLGLVLSHVGFAEKELAVEVGNVDCVCGPSA